MISYALAIQQVSFDDLSLVAPTKPKNFLSKLVRPLKRALLPKSRKAKIQIKRVRV